MWTDSIVLVLPRVVFCSYQLFDFVGLFLNSSNIDGNECKPKMKHQLSQHVGKENEELLVRKERTSQSRQERCNKASKMQQATEAQWFCRRNCYTSTCLREIKLMLLLGNKSFILLASRHLNFYTIGYPGSCYSNLVVEIL